jgi:hypothetical protein
VRALRRRDRPDEGGLQTLSRPATSPRAPTLNACMR